MLLDEFINEQPIAYKVLLNSLKSGKLSHAYLFETNNYQRGFDMALSFAKYLLCENHFTNKDKCLDCLKCNIIDRQEYPELKIINSDGIWIKKDQLDNLQKDFSKKSFSGGNQVYIINNAERLNTQAANSILKFLEEPEPNIIAILVTNNKYSLLDTIVSRCQIISLKDVALKTRELTMIEKIGYHLFNNNETVTQFIENKKNEEIINKVIEFINYYEKNGIDTILFSNKLWHSVIKEKEDFINAFSIIILFYKDVLSYKIKGQTEIFDFDNNIEYICNNNTEQQLCNKINVILKNKEKIKFNINLSLLIDSLIIEMGKIND